MQMLRGSLESRKSGKSGEEKEFKQAYKIENQNDGHLTDIDGVKVVSYNILSSETFPSSHYRKLDRSINSIEPSDRKECINKKILGWLTSNHIICLQEVTADFMGADTNPDLHKTLSKNKYNAYYHHYKYNGEKKKNMLGLAILVPNSFYTIMAYDLLRPWANQEKKVVDGDRIKENQGKIMKLTESMKELSPLIKTPDQDRIRRVSERLISTYAITDESIKTNPGKLCAALKQMHSNLSRENEEIIAPYRKSPPNIGDRTIIILHLIDNQRRNLVVANVHVPCQYENPVAMTTLALRTKEHIINWMKAKTLDSFPLVLCGDLNSDPDDAAGKAYHCFAGNISYDPTNVNTEYISKYDFKKYVEDEKWYSCLRRSHISGLTNYGFTENSMKRCIQDIRAAMEDCGLNSSMFIKFILNDDVPDFDEIFEDYLQNSQFIEREIEDSKEELKEKIKSNIAYIKSQKSNYIKPKPLHLDHIFIRDEHSILLIESYDYPSKLDTIERLEGNPIPNLDKGEPSDHLPISVSLKFKDVQ